MTFFNQKEIGDRIKQIRRAFQLKNQEEFAAMLGVTQTQMSKYENGTNSLPDELKFMLSEKGINLHWLLTGRGEMYVGAENKNEKEVVKYLSLLLAETQKENEALRHELELVKKTV